MGMLDSVFAPCPECSRLVEFQSKAGECELKRYKYDNVPLGIAEDVHNKPIECRCGCTVVITVLTERVSLTIKKYEDNDWD